MEDEQTQTAGSEPLSAPDGAARGFADANNVLRYNGGDLFSKFESPARVAELVPRGSRVLDIGCSSGELTEYIRETRQAVVVGVEPEPARARAAIARGLNVYQGVLTPSLVEKLGPFDIVLLVDVIEHLAAPADLLILARQSLARGGALILSTPNIAHWSIRANLARGRFDYASTGLMDATHLRWFTRRTLRQLLETSGYRIEHQDVSAGAWLSQYQAQRPWRWVAPERRARLIRSLADRWPEMFGCQHIIKAVPE